MHQVSRLLKSMFPIFVFLILVPVSAAAEDVDFHDILVELDQQGSFAGSDFSCIYTIVSEKPGEDRSIMEAKLFRRDEDDKFLLLILKPEVNKGEGYLQVEDNMWFYDPESRKFMHTSMKEQFGESEANNSDFEASSLAEDYSITSVDEGMLGKYPVYIMDLAANHDEVTYARVKLWVRIDNHLTLKTESYSVTGRKMRTDYYPAYMRVEGHYMPSKMLLLDELNPGQKSEITIRDVSLSLIPDSVFSKAYLERVSQ